MTDPNDLRQCLPLQSISDIMSWEQPAARNWSALVKRLKKRAEFTLKEYPVCGSCPNVKDPVSNIPKTLVCHDMKGGYLNDRLVSGHKDLNDYKFLAWPCIDVFVYFSHKCLTIPPLAWINAGHSHGVPVLGTFITEESSVWHRVLSDKSSCRKLAHNMAAICRYYGFDGYLLNIENELNPEFINSTFLYFIQCLHGYLKNISSDKLLIWYDAVTKLGILNWQNELNDMNSLFFNACDGIFLNYSWNEQSLAKTVSFAGDRLTDVYVGIDIFGRGCYGGGGFNTNKAFSLIRKYGLSAAIFAPGWVHECSNPGENPECRDFKFWSLISEYLYTFGPSELPFDTSFCRGFGKRTYKDGLVINDEPWFDQSKITHLPAILSGCLGLETDSCFQYYDKDGFSGGGCLLITQKMNKDNDIDHIDRLLHCDFSLSHPYKILIRVIAKPFKEKGVNCEVDLLVTTGKVENKRFPLEETEQIHRFPLSFNESDMVNSWYESRFKLELGDYHLISIGCQLKGKSPPVLFGFLGVYQSLNIVKSGEGLY